ncbi:hypothetical protein Phum_PHUM265470 [Pediculus humanus corporis]|uniref:Uncharacterized protein n=1 Tax=Pediculus humanus subsp. corporis TaxID=121224 RepID=E0VKI9_PEDHC|nr:uncharacterized protein Phum_PHUM265470 [Pediculus humanus corporis]EEB13895.1 hypothetical protein Phum_PHUM265470 [Pediculus humanus corporis]
MGRRQGRYENNDLWQSGKKNSLIFLFLRIKTDKGLTRRIEQGKKKKFLLFIPGQGREDS